MSDFNELKSYLIKLIKTIETQSNFNFGGKHLVDKQRIDDILCCIDANFPLLLKNYQKKYNNLDKNIKSFKTYEMMIANIKISPPMGKNSYFVNYEQVKQLCNTLVNEIEFDIKYLQEHYPDL